MSLDQVDDDGCVVELVKQRPACAQTGQVKENRRIDGELLHVIDQHTLKYATRLGFIKVRAKDVAVIRAGGLNTERVRLARTKETDGDQGFVTIDGFLLFPRIHVVQIRVLGVLWLRRRRKVSRWFEQRLCVFTPRLSQHGVARLNEFSRAFHGAGTVAPIHVVVVTGWPNRKVNGAPPKPLESCERVKRRTCDQSELAGESIELEQALLVNGVEDRQRFQQPSRSNSSGTCP